MSGIPSIEPYRMPTRRELPDNTAGWTVQPERAVLLVHDMQRYFVGFLPTGTPPTSDLVRNAVRLRRACADHGVPVAYTTQPGGMTDQQRGLLKDFWGPGMTVAPLDREVIPQLSPGPADWLLTKWRYSAFFRSDLLARMRVSGRDQLIICGVYAHVGVLATAIEAFTNDIQTFLVADAVADFSADRHRLAVEYAAQRCAVVATTDEVLADLGHSRSPQVGSSVREGRR